MKVRDWRCGTHASALAAMAFSVFLGCITEPTEGTIAVIDGDAVRATAAQTAEPDASRVCGEPDPVEPLELLVLGHERDQLMVLVRNVSEATLDAGIVWRIASERNELSGRLELGPIIPGSVATVTLSLSEDLGVNLAPHLGPGEIVLWPCRLVDQGCRPSNYETALYFLASEVGTQLGTGDMPAYASEAGRQLATASGLLDEALDESGASGASNLAVRVTKLSDTVDFLPPPEDEGEGEVSGEHP